MKPYISVIIPVYNVELYLIECIDSVLSQTYKNTEIILVNDGSTDKSGTLCDAYACRDSRIKVLHKENGGLSSARNAGMDIAKGDYIMFLDSDDYWESITLIEDLVTVLISNSTIGILQFAVSEFNDGETPLLNRNTSNSLKCIKTKDIIYGELDYGYNTLAWNKIYKSEFINFLRFPEGVWYEDEYFSLDTLTIVDAVWIDQSIGFYCYRQRNNSIMDATRKKCVKSYIDRTKVSAYMMQFFQKHSASETRLRNIAMFGISNLLLALKNNWDDIRSIRRCSRLFKNHIPSIKEIKSQYCLTDLLYISILRYFGASVFTYTFLLLYKIKYNK